MKAQKKSEVLQFAAPNAQKKRRGLKSVFEEGTYQLPRKETIFVHVGRGEGGGGWEGAVDAAASKWG